MSIARFEISEMPLPPQRYWPTAGAQKGTQCGNLTIGVGANLFSRSLGRQATFGRTVSWFAIPVKLFGEPGQLCRQ